ncbi:DUF3060 domain-containing protein [Microbacterium sp.]|uniref:DUF3060 domain-containing protein n=1 Tax=Microbacterium sp. TaxID=51671 RepID=UPI002FE396C7
MRSARRPTAATVVLLTVVLISGCTVSIIDPTDRDRPSETPSSAETPADASPQETDDDPDTAETPATSGYSPEHAAERARLIDGATVTMSCPSGVLAQDGAVIRVEGSCEELVIEMDAGVVITDDVEQLTISGDGTVVYAETIGTVTVSGSADQVYWTGPTPVVQDSGTANALGRG